MKHKTYEITLKHDNGTVSLTVSAENIEAAKQLVCNAENAPLRAVQSWRVIPTAAQVRKTKSLMRGL